MPSDLGSKHFRIQELQPGVFAAIATDEGWAVANAGIVDLGDHTLVFDAFSNHIAAADLNRNAEALTGKKVDYVVVGHAHRDHYKGTQAFEHATIVSTRKSTELMAALWRARTERVRKEGLEFIRKGVKEEFDAWKSSPDTTDADRILWDSYEQSLLQDLESYDLKLPSIGFDSSMAFHGSRRTAEATDFDGGHSKSDAILFLPEERVAYLGDLLFIGYQPFIGEGSIEGLLGILDKVEALDPKILVPGHGPPGTVKEMQPMREYLMTLQKIADEGRTSEANRKSLLNSPIPALFASMKWRAFWRANLESLIGKPEN